MMNWIRAAESDSRAVALLLLLFLGACVSRGSPERSGPGQEAVVRRSQMDFPSRSPLDATERARYAQLDALCDATLKAAGYVGDETFSDREKMELVMWGFVLIPVVVVVVIAALA